VRSRSATNWNPPADRTQGPACPVGDTHPRKPQSAHRAIARSTSRGQPLVEHLLDCLDSGTIPVTTADLARHVLEIMPPRTSARVARVAELTTTFAP
jgi:hypothetical protein